MLMAESYFLRDCGMILGEKRMTEKVYNSFVEGKQSIGE